MHASGSTMPVGENFGKLFPELETFEPPIEFLRELGAIDGIMDEGFGDDDSSISASIPAGFTFLGQFIDHDVTRDDESLEESIDPATGMSLRNIRTPVLELDSLYGDGPDNSPEGMYRSEDPDKFSFVGPRGFDPVPSSDQVDDLPRMTNGAAIIGDNRNDENVIISQLHLAFLKFHNTVVDFVRRNRRVLEDGETVFDGARRIVTWHYQWIVLDEYLPLTVGRNTVEDILSNGRKFYTPQGVSNVFMPLEFSVAAFRLGHSQVRNRFIINDTVEKRLFDLSFFGPTPANSKIDWRYFFTIPPYQSPRFPQFPQFSKKLDPKISKILLQLPLEIAEMRPLNLAVRNLIRGLNRGLASGQSVARKMGYTPLTNEQLGIKDLSDKYSVEEAPLWFYILKEAELQTNGDTLGEVGGRIVAETIIGLLQEDPKSFLAARTNWRPFLPTFNGERNKFTMTDLITFVRDSTLPPTPRA